MSMRVLLDFVGMPALHNHHCFTFSTATLAELCREDVTGSFSCSSECKYRKCRYTVLLVGGLAPLISFTTHSSKSDIFSFPFDLVVIVDKLVYELFIKHLTIFLCEKQNSQSYWYAYCSYIAISYFNNFCRQIHWSYLSFVLTNNDCSHLILTPKVPRYAG